MRHLALKSKMAEVSHSLLNYNAVINNALTWLSMLHNTHSLISLFQFHWSVSLTLYRYVMKQDMMENELVFISTLTFKGLLGFCVRVRIRFRAGGGG